MPDKKPQEKRDPADPRRREGGAPTEKPPARKEPTDTTPLFEGLPEGERVPELAKKQSGAPGQPPQMAEHDAAADKGGYDP